MEGEDRLKERKAKEANCEDDESERVKKNTAKQLQESNDRLHLQRINQPYGWDALEI